jgi:hypothetical protein
MSTLWRCNSRALERPTRPGYTFTCPVSAGGSTVTDMTTTTPYTLNVDSRLLSHVIHLPETIECACGYARVDPMEVVRQSLKDARR